MLIPLLAFLAPCNNEVEETTASPKISLDYPLYPSAIKYLDDDATSTRAGVYDNNKWEEFEVIKIYFMNGEPAIQNKVKEIAKQYVDLTSLTFKYVDDINVSDVRIRFAYVNESPYEFVNWSFLGKDHRDQTKIDSITKLPIPTMNLVIQDRNAYINSDMFRGEILRNFGRMLGMVYEYSHINDDMYIELLRGEVERDFARNNWNLTSKERAKIRRLFFAPAVWEGDLTNNGVTPGFDPTSIMLPPIPSHWIDYDYSESTNIDEIADKMNTQLSAKDKEYIASVYPIPTVVYKPGKEGNVKISIEGTSYNQFYVGWDYTTNQSAGRIINDYPTIGIGEYEWTRVNLRIKYEGPQFNFVNYDNRMVKFLAGDAFGDDANTVDKFERVFGSWATENSNKAAWLYATSYRENANFTRIDTEYQPTDISFDLPDPTAIYQLFGQTPQKTGSIHRDFRDFTFGLAEENPQLKQKLGVKMPFMREDNQNLSKLSLVPLGSMHAHASNVDVYSNPSGLWGNGAHLTAFINPGTGVSLKMKEAIRNLTFQDPTLHYPIFVNNYLYHWGSVRYCRALTDQELGYKLYIDE